MLAATVTRILIVAPDGPETAELIANLAMNFDADFTQVESIADAWARMADGCFDVIVATQCLVDGSGLDILNDDTPLETPVVLIEDEIIPERVVTALRRGAADLLPTPVDYDYLVRRIRRVVQDQRLDRQADIRAQRLRRLSSRLVKDRRELRQRVDLICTDLVTAYQRLAERVVHVMDPAVQGRGNEAPLAALSEPSRS